MRITYSDEHLTGSFHCSFCGKDFPIHANVHTWYGDDSRMYPRPANVIHAHFHFDQNAHIPECTAVGRALNVKWEAVNLDTQVVKERGRVIVSLTKQIEVVTDFPTK